MIRIHEEDREMFKAMLSKEKVIKEVEHGEYIVDSRFIDFGKPMKARMRFTKMHGTNRIMLGIKFI